MYLLGIDVGTTNTKAVVFDTDTGQVRAQGHARTITRHPTKVESEFDANELWNAVVQCLQQAIAQCDFPEQIRAIAVASMGEAGFPLDAQGNVLYPAIAWHDPRTTAQAQWWSDTLGRERLYTITGHVLQPMFGINKLLWLRDNRPDVFRNMHQWLSIEDFVLWKLSGRMVTDYSIASRTMMFDQQTLTWSNTLFDHIGMSTNKFPSTVTSGTAIGPIAKHLADEMGLSPTTTIVTGGHDHLCAALAVGVMQPGQILDSTGTAGVVLALSKTFQASNDLLIGGYASYAYVLPHTYVTMGSIHFAGGALEWLLHLLYGNGIHTLTEEIYTQALQEGAQAPLGSNGVTILPYLLGTGTPYGQDTATATLLGLTPAHGRPELVRALIEGLSFWLRDNLETFTSIGIAPSHPEIIAVGGATRATALMQIKADITGCRIKVPLIAETAATGAALLAGIGVQAFPSVTDAIASVQHTEKTYEPEQEASRAYDVLYERVYIPARRSILGR
ncbi:MAG: xylulokinase [Ktedonobacteraceae bacterium]